MSIGQSKDKLKRPRRNTMPRSDPRALQAAAKARIRRTLSTRFLEGAGWVRLRIVSDFLALVAGCAVGLIVSPSHHGAVLLFVFPPLALLLLHSRGRYVVGKRDLVLDDAAPGFGAVSISAMAVFTLQLLVTDERDAVGSLVAWTWLASLAAVTSVGIGLPLMQRAARKRGLVGAPTLVVGTDVSALDIALRLHRHPEYGLRPVGFLADQTLIPSGDLPPVLGGLSDLERVAATHDVRTIIIGYPDSSPEEMLEFIARCDTLGLQTNIVPRLYSVVNYQTRFDYLGTVPLLNLRAINLESWRFSVKHAIDRVVASLLLILLAPLLAILALGVRLSSPGPILFRQVRAGRDGRAFNLLKFRTMVEPNPDLPRHELRRGLAPGGVEGVDRRTPIGRILRRISLDELLQLINVVRGDMSLVGPRPERPEFAELFQREIERYSDRHRVRAGITGWAQIHGARGQTELADRVELDNFYIEHWSLALDLKIMLLTIPALVRGS